MNISIVIPVYDRQLDGERAIRSALLGGGPWREIIVVDDASPEPFRLPYDLAGDPRIKLIRHETNKGESGARNTGVREAAGPWIAFLDSDDFWLPGKLGVQSEFAMADQSQNPDTLTFYSHGFIQSNTSTGRRRALIPVASSNPDDFASGCWFMQGTTILFHKDAAAAAGPCDEKLRRLQDLDWFLRMALAGGQLKVAEFIGAEIEVGTRPRPEALEIACQHMEEKWFGDSSVLRSSQERRLSSYLDVERAAARRYCGDLLGTAYYLGRSLLKVPRRRVHLRNWWRDAAP